MESGSAVLRREYSDYEVLGRLPWYWGMSYQKLLTARVVYYVIPINLFVRWGRDFLFWICSAGVRGYRQRTENAVYLRGLQAGQGNIRSRILCTVANNLIAQGLPPVNANELAEHILKAHLGI